MIEVRTWGTVLVDGVADGSYQGKNGPGSGELCQPTRAAGCAESDFVVLLAMAWSPVRRLNAG
jgi:hypothetical protein